MTTRLGLCGGYSKGHHHGLQANMARIGTKGCAFGVAYSGEKSGGIFGAKEAVN